MEQVKVKYFTNINQWYTISLIGISKI